MVVSGIRNVSTGSRYRKNISKFELYETFVAFYEQKSHNTEQSFTMLDSGLHARKVFSYYPDSQINVVLI